MARSHVLLASFVFATALGCVASSESSNPVGASVQALHGAGTIYAWYYAQWRIVAIHTCPIEDTPDQLAIEAAGGPESMPCDDGATNVVAAQVKVLDASGKLVDDIHADRPGGGCVHVSVPDAVAGGTLAVHAVVKGMPGTGSAADVFDLTIAVP